MSLLPTESKTLTIPKQMLPFHDHPLSCEEAFDVSCPWCDLWESKNGIVYRCPECDFVLHKECIERFLDKPFQCNHFLKVVKNNISPDNGKEQCHFCQWYLPSLFVRCTICNISLDLNCVVHPLPLTIFQPKHHKHNLTLLLRLVTFTCNACGLEGDRNPYVCLQCNLMVHKDCIDLPRVIIINRHEHRVSHTFHLGQGDWECGVCRKTIDWVYGGYTCSRCPSYAVHSNCATRNEVWDGIELEDVPEEDEEIEDPFKVINDKDIIHFSHEKHILRLYENCVMDNNMRCEGCLLPINDNPCYKCVECDFCLHKACASLPRRKRHLLHNHKLTLRVEYKDKADAFKCSACRIMSGGFRYECDDERCNNIKFDTRCSSIFEPFHHDLHPHPLYWTLEGPKRCQACHKRKNNSLSCTICEYALCIKCATLPRKVKHRCDDHFLSLCHDLGNSNGDLWCDICETKTDPSVCYYTCDECGLSLHIKCVLGDLYYMKVGHGDPAIEVLANNGVTRPICSRCKVRCKFPFLLKESRGSFVCYFCSIKCSP